MQAWVVCRDGFFKRRRFASFFSSRQKRIKTTRKVAEKRELLTYSIDQATFASPTFDNEVKIFRIDGNMSITLRFTVLETALCRQAWSHRFKSQQILGCSHQVLLTMLIDIAMQVIKFRCYKYCTRSNCCLFIKVISKSYFLKKVQKNKKIFSFQNIWSKRRL